MPNENEVDVFQVRLHTTDWTYETRPDETLLQAALDHGLKLPSSCRNGTCRACMARLVEGRVEYRIDWPGLSREEKDEGWILPCVACARSDVVLDAPGTINLFDVPPPLPPTPLIAPRPTVRTSPEVSRSDTPRDDVKS